MYGRLTRRGRWTRIARKFGLHIRQIVLKNIIYLNVQNIDMSPL